jgi:hypothetical protein
MAKKSAWNGGAFFAVNDARQASPVLIPTHLKDSQNRIYP